MNPEKELAQDIVDKLISDFGSDHVSDAMDLLISSSVESARLLRCIIYLAGDDLEKLRHYIECAEIDFRDVIYWAEYVEGQDKAEPIRLRDFNKIFPDSEF